MKNINFYVITIILSSLLLMQFTTACVRMDKKPESEEKKNTKIEEFNVVGYSLKTSLENDKYVNDLESLWNKLEEGFDAKLFHSRADDNIYVVMFNYQGEGLEKFEVTLGYKVKNPAANLKDKFASVKVPSSKYFLKKVDGNDSEDVLKTWGNIIESDAELNYKYNFEVYSFDDDFEITTIEIYTSVDDK